MKKETNKDQSALIAFVASRLSVYTNHREKVNAMKSFLSICAEYKLTNVNNETLTNCLPRLRNYFISEVNSENLIEYEIKGLIYLIIFMYNNTDKKVASKDIFDTIINSLTPELGIEFFPNAICEKDLPNYAIESISRKLSRPDFLNTDDKLNIALTSEYSEKVYHKVIKPLDNIFYKDYILDVIEKSKSDKEEKEVEENILDISEFEKYLKFLEKAKQYGVNKSFYDLISKSFFNLEFQENLRFKVFSLIESFEEDDQIRLIKLYLQDELNLFENITVSKHFLSLFKLVIGTKSSVQKKLKVIARDSIDLKKDVAIFIANQIDNYESNDDDPSILEEMLNTCNSLMNEKEIDDDVKVKVLSSIVRKIYVEHSDFEIIINWIDPHKSYLEDSIIRSEIKHIKDEYEGQFKEPTWSQEKRGQLENYFEILIKCSRLDLFEPSMFEIKDLEITELTSADEMLVKSWSKFMLECEKFCYAENPTINLKFYKSLLVQNNEFLNEIVVNHLHPIATILAVDELNDYQDQLEQVSNNISDTKSSIQSYELLILNTNVSIEELLLSYESISYAWLFKLMKYQEAVTKMIELLFANLKDLEIEDTQFKNTLLQLDDMIVAFSASNKIAIDRADIDSQTQNLIEYYYNSNLIRRDLKLKLLLDFMYMNFSSAKNINQYQYKVYFKKMMDDYKSLKSILKNVNRVTGILKGAKHFWETEYLSPFLKIMKKRRK